MPSSPSDPVLQLSNLTIGYAAHGKTTVVASGLSASLDGGELVCLLGPNGAGKSTLLRTLAGFQPPLGGSVTLAGRLLSDYKPQELARTVSVVLTEKPHVQNMTAMEMALMGRMPHTGFLGRHADHDREAALEALRMVGMEPLAQRRVATLSDGERQKVMIAKALAQQTPLILLDEPTAFLDYPSKAELMRTLSRVCREAGRTALLSTHDVPQALECSHRVWLMAADGKLSTGTPEEIKKNGLLSRVFGM